MKLVRQLEILFALIPAIVCGQTQEGCVRNYNENGRLSQSAMTGDFDLEELASRNYSIPTVIHVFHDGDLGRLTSEQVMSGINVVNQDFQALNDDWNEVPSTFESIKSALSLELCLTTLDEQGNETSGIIYYDDTEAAYNRKDLTDFGWDNYKYLNIYLPIYVYGEPSDRTAFTNLPSEFFSSNGNDGIFYSSIRWGYGEDSELEIGSELASIATHEIGHWLNLRHTFNNECDPPGDFVDDTPPVQTTEINFLPCSEITAISCDQNANISNYMDYNHGCKKMFTQGQINRMLLALQSTVRKPIWNVENLYATGCLEASEEPVRISYSPQAGFTFFFDDLPATLSVYNLSGSLIFQDEVNSDVYKYKPVASFREVQIFTFTTTQGVIRKKLYVD